MLAYADARLRASRILPANHTYRKSFVGEAISPLTDANTTTLVTLLIKDQFLRSHGDNIRRALQIAFDQVDRDEVTDLECRKKSKRTSQADSAQERRGEDRPALSFVGCRHE